MHYSIEIHDAEERELITAIEIISPANKRGKGRVQYLEKRERMFESGVHLVEIDLLRSGHRLPMEQPYPEFPYFILIHRSETRPIADVWPISSDAPLPVIPIPLSNGDPPARVDLQDALNNVYADFKFDMVIDYSKPPPVQPPTWKGQAR